MFISRRIGSRRNGSRPNGTNSLGASDEETTLNLLKDYPCYEAVFVMELAKHVEGKLDEVMQGGLSTYTHTFLIRRPDKAIYSWFKCGLKIPDWTVLQLS